MRRVFLALGVITMVVCNSFGVAQAGPLKLLKKGLRKVHDAWVIPKGYVPSVQDQLSDMQSQIDFNTATNMSQSMQMIERSLATTSGAVSTVWNFWAANFSGIACTVCGARVKYEDFLSGFVCGSPRAPGAPPRGRYGGSSGHSFSSCHTLIRHIIRKSSPRIRPCDARFSVPAYDPTFG